MPRSRKRLLVHLEWTQRERHTGKALRPRDVLVRAAVCEVTREQLRPNQYEDVHDVVRRRYGDDEATRAYITRTQPDRPSARKQPGPLNWSTPRSPISSATWRRNPALSNWQRALKVTLEAGTGIVKVPSRASPLALMGAWIGGGSAKPVFAGVLTPTNLTPNKLAAVSTFTEEMAQGTMIEAIVRETLAHDLTALLDTALFNATAASAVRPAGLFSGATVVTKSAATPLTDAMFADLGALAGAVSGNNADARVVYVANPVQDEDAAAGVDVITAGNMPAARDRTAYAERISTALRPSSTPSGAGSCDLAASLEKFTKPRSNLDRLG